MSDTVDADAILALHRALMVNEPRHTPGEFRTEAGILVETTNGPRNRVWRAPEVLAALDAFAERAGRRG